MPTTLEAWLPLQLGTFIAVLIRVASWIAFAPVLGNDAVPARVKAGLSAALTVALLGAVPAPAAPGSISGWAWLIASEAIFGLLMGLALHLIFDGIQFAGHIFGIQLGHSLASIIDPHTQADTPVISVFYQIVAMLLFLGLDAHHWILRGLARSFALVPPGSFAVGDALVREALRLAGQLWVIGMEMAAPILLVTLLADLALGFLGKESPQLPVLLEGISLKTVIGFLLLLSAVAAWPRLIAGYILAAFRNMEGLMAVARN